MSREYKAAVIGLGNIGFLFDFDHKREGTWSHVGAYTRCSSTLLVGVAETDEKKVRLFRKTHPHVPTFRRAGDLLDSLAVDIVSICTPTSTHQDVFREVAEYPVRAIFCEKPIAGNLEGAEEMVHKAVEKGILVAVNHTRRWDSAYRLASEMVGRGEIGRVRGVHGYYPGKLFNVGSHLLDVMRMTLDSDPLNCCGFSLEPGEDDPDISGWIQFGGGVVGTVNALGPPKNLVFEIDLIGEEGRVRVIENGERVEAYRFAESLRYTGYKEFKPMTVAPVEKRDRFLEAIQEIVAVLDGGRRDVSCSGRDGYLSLAMCQALVESARKLNKPVEVKYV